MFVDTSAFFAVADPTDQNHSRARELWVQALEGNLDLVCTNYVLVETIALMQRRLGLGAVRAFATDVVPLLEVEWVHSEHHQTALAAVLAAGRRDLSLVDCISFDAMRRLGINQVFAFDADFTQQGFECLP